MASRLIRHACSGLRRRRAFALGLLSVVVLLLHAWVTERVAESSVTWRSSEQPQRIEVAFVRELQPTAPPAAPPVPLKAKPKPKKRLLAAAPARPKASSPEVEPKNEAPPGAAEEAASAPDVEALAAADLPASAPAAEEVASAPSDASSAAMPASAASAAGPAFEWPPSTSLSYRLTGNYRGPVEGSAQVRWIRNGTRYQVQVDVNISLVVTRRMTSDGELTDEGLAPRRYDEETEVVLGSTRRATVRFEDAAILLANGKTAGRPPGVQDTASQLVQLTWLFTTRPDSLKPGRTVELPLALPWRVDRWVFDVLDNDTLDTPMGRVPVVHVKPRRPDRSDNVLTVESWFAPTLQYLPARIRINQDAETYVDLMLQSLPMQANR
ncbi:MAG TPA: DUF3108 domain-containing protein [Burkholderiaceae bacterium]|nr:DUF3108 domain-containing protein [Burkholderiaceae bacterium]